METTITTLGPINRQPRELKKDHLTTWDLEQELIKSFRPAAKKERPVFVLQQISIFIVSTHQIASEFQSNLIATWSAHDSVKRR